MFRYICQRVGFMLIALFLVILFTFFLIHSVPGGPFANPSLKPEVRLVVERRFHLDQPTIVQFGYFLAGALRLDFGISLIVQPQREVFAIIAERFPVTIILNLLSNILILPFGFALGIIAALKRNTLTDHAVSAMVVLFISVPGFILASLLQYFLAFKLGWFPLTFSTSQNWDSGRFYSMILPVLAMSFGGIAFITRYLRAELTEALNSDYMLLAKTKGLLTHQAVLRHAVRNSLIPIMGMLVGIFVGILGGSVVVEQIFSIPGIGRVMVEALFALDYPVVMGSTLMYTAISLLARLLVDLSYGVVDPRIVVGGGKNVSRD
ncbi:MAG: ABC transporter permease [Treponema sp.]|nr:ABC transporter permease [Treponema sp.]